MGVVVLSTVTYEAFAQLSNEWRLMIMMVVSNDLDNCCINDPDNCDLLHYLIYRKVR